MVVFAEASGAEQSLLPYVHSTPFGQHGGHADSDTGKSSGQGGCGAGFPLYRQAPRVHVAIGEPHAPNAHVVPSGSTHAASGFGAAFGQTLSPSAPVGPPESGLEGPAGRSSLHATAIAAKAVNTATAARTSLCFEELGLIRREPRSGSIGERLEL
jgi:hypothetical protein